MNWSRVGAIMKKDIKAITASKMVMIPMFVVPLILCIAMPAVVLIVAFTMDTVVISGAQFFEKLIPLYPVPENLNSMTDKIMYIFLNYTFLPLFMLLPIMASSIIASNSIVGEKERKTLETLLYTPVTNREFMVAKLLSAFIPAVLISYGGFIGFFSVLNLISYLYRNILIIRSWIWLPAILLLSPSVSLLGLSITLVVSLKAKSFADAQQMAGLIVLPFIALIIVQITGVITFNALYVVLFSIVLVIISYLIIVRVAPRFSRENIISTL
ncbi:hypothetical protein ES703_28099 [subsurface metagenome]